MTEQPTEFRVAFADSTGEIIGLQPTAPVGDGFSIAVLSAEEYDKVMTLDTAYVSADGTQVVDTPR